MRTLRAAAVVALLALDRATKIWAAGSLKAVGTIPLIPFFDLTYVENVARSIAQYMPAYRLIIEKSTVPVQTGQWVKHTILHGNRRPLPRALFCVLRKL